MKQPEALHHADYIEHWNPDDPIAKELRRLHEENKAMSETSSQIIADNMRLHEANKAMLDALKGLCGDRVYDYHFRAAHAAIAKGEQQ